MFLLISYFPDALGFTLLTMIVFILLLVVYLGLYHVVLDKNAPKSNKKRKYKRKVRKVSSSYNKAILLKGITPIITIILILCIYGFITNNHTIWNIIQYILILLPGSILIPIHSEVYEKKREGYIYTSITPKHKIMIERFAFGALVSESFISLVYIAALLTGLETGLGKLLVLVSCGLLLAMVGLTIANITKNSMAGYTSALLLWCFGIVGGSNLEEILWSLFFLFISAALLILNVAVIKSRES
jgi:hypothetical protein